MRRKIRRRLMLAAILLAGAAVGLYLFVEYDERRCLALNVYHEAAGEPELGQLLVGYVTVARARENRPYWGGTSICGVVYKKENKNGKVVPQFSWTVLRKEHPPRSRAWTQAWNAADAVRSGKFVPDHDFAAARFYLNPQKAQKEHVCWFEKTLVKVGEVGAHHFYREPRGAREWAVLKKKECKKEALAKK